MSARISHRISNVQLTLRICKLSRVNPVVAASWLSATGILRDSPQRRGMHLRERLREGGIIGQHQEPNGRWYINAAPLVNSNSFAAAAA
jgi:hypothetical protein